MVAKGSGELRLLLRGIDYSRLFKSADPPGAMTPVGARETLTRVALRKRHERQKAFRAGILLSAIRAT